MKSLFSRLLLSVSVTVFILIIALWQWFQFSQDFSRNQIQQSLHSELALHMAHINPLLSQGATSDKALKEAFHDFMLLGPSFEIYTLDITGKVIAYDANEDNDDYTQAGNLYRILPEDEKERLVTNLASTMKTVQRSTLHTIIGHFTKCDQDYGKRIEAKLNYL